MKTFLVIIAVVIGITGLYLARPAAAAAGCGDYEMFKAAMLTRYHETPRVNAINLNSMTFFQILKSPQGTFSILILLPNNRACIIAAGEGWTEIRERPPSDSQLSSPANNRARILLIKGKDT